MSEETGFEGEFPLDVPTMQQAVWEWRQRQPWADEPPTMTTLGLAEEVGEVCRASLKLAQGIRGTQEEWLAEIEKELGDVFIKLLDVASVYGINAEHALVRRWADIRQRNWSANPTGHGIEKA